jgi:hypothetical protein
MFKFVAKVLQAWGKAIEKKYDTYKPQYRGQWKNRGTDKNENWVWVEKGATKNYKVNVFQLEDDYIITVGYRARGNAIEVVDCKDDRELEIALELLAVYYGTLGNVVTNREVQ